MALLSSSAQNNENKVLSSLDGFLTVLEKYPNNVCQEANVSANPFSFLVAILKRCGVTEEELIKWLVNFLKYQLPVIELGVKGILLANMKNLISCSVDPRIPAYARDENSGMTFNLSLIDSGFMLDSSPLDKLHNQMYFGIESGSTLSPYDFLRPKDFNTFLWYIINRGRYPSPSIINGETDYETTFKEKFLANVITREISKKANSIFDITELSYGSSTNSGILLGNSFKERINKTNLLNQISVCAKLERDENGNIVYNKLLPVGSSWDRTNYYVNRPTYFNFIDPSGKKDETNPRDYNKDVALCSFKYVDTYNDKNETKDYYKGNKINIRILPKPLVHVPQLGQTLLLPKKILFNNDGVADENGRFSVVAVSNCYNNVTEETSELIKQYLSNDSNEKIKSVSGNTAYRWSYQIQNQSNKSECNFYVVLNSKGEYWISKMLNGDEISETERKLFLPYLQECYTNLTIYEFNYDYIMSMRLYDAKVVVTQLINQLMQMRMGFALTVTSTQYEGQDKLFNIVSNIVESNDYESSDCFFTFSNDKYDTMSRNAELKFANQASFGSSSVSNDNYSNEILDALDDFGDSATLQENIDTFKYLISVTSANIYNRGTSDYEKYEIEFNGKDIITQFITNLASILINSLLSPKIILMILINMELCGQLNTKKISIEEILNQMIGMITEIVKEIRDVILKELLSFVLNKLISILKELNIMLLQEQAEYFRRLIKQLLSDCWFKNGNEIATTIDNVNYADIDTPQEQPENNKC